MSLSEINNKACFVSLSYEEVVGIVIKRLHDRYRSLAKKFDFAHFVICAVTINTNSLTINDRRAKCFKLCRHFGTSPRRNGSIFFPFYFSYSYPPIAVYKPAPKITVHFETANNRYGAFAGNNAKRFEIKRHLFGHENDIRSGAIISIFKSFFRQINNFMRSASKGFELLKVRDVYGAKTKAYCAVISDASIGHEKAYPICRRGRDYGKRILVEQ